MRKTALIVLITKTGSRLVREFPAAGRGWFNQAMRYTAKGLDPKSTTQELFWAGVEVASMVVISPDGEVWHYSWSECLELLGGAL